MYCGCTPITATSLAPMWTVYQPNISSGCPGIAKIGSSATTSARPSPRSMTPASMPVPGGTITDGSGFPNLCNRNCVKIPASILPILGLPVLMVIPRKCAYLAGNFQRIAPDKNGDRLFTDSPCLIEDLGRPAPGGVHGFAYLPGHRRPFARFVLPGS